jgi:hypothetical protein
MSDVANGSWSVFPLDLIVSATIAADDPSGRYSPLQTKSRENHASTVESAENVGYRDGMIVPRAWCDLPPSGSVPALPDGLFF